MQASIAASHYIEKSTVSFNYKIPESKDKWQVIFGLLEKKHISDLNAKKHITKIYIYFDPFKS
jgi:hypothetical protein